MTDHARWLARVAASAAVRKVVYLLIAAIVAYGATLFAGGEAKAHTVPGCNPRFAHCYTHAEALQEANSYNPSGYDQYCATNARPAMKLVVDTTPTTGPKSVTIRIRCGAVPEAPPSTNFNFSFNITFDNWCPTGTNPNGQTGQCDASCDAKPDMNFLGWDVQDGDVICFDSCEYAVMPQSAGGGQASLGTGCDGAHPHCATSGGDYELITGLVAPSGVCRPVDSDGDGVPNISDPFPNDPGETSDSDGDGIGDGTDNAPNDPDNGEDGEGEEDGDDEGDNVSTGGGNCAFPPESSGDGILAQIAFQTWKTRCALERSQNADGSLKMTGTGAGGGVLVIGGGDGDGDGDDEPPTAPNEADYLGDGTGEGTAESVMTENEIGGDGFDQSGFGWQRSCPVVPDVVVYGKTLHFNTTPMCEWLNLGGWFVMLVAMIVSLRILMQA